MKICLHVFTLMVLLAFSARAQRKTILFNERLRYRTTGASRGPSVMNGPVALAFCRVALAGIKRLFPGFKNAVVNF